MIGLKGWPALQAASGSSKRFNLFPNAHPAANLISQWFASTPEEVGANEGGRHVPDD
jgi:hypothetical protein